MTITETAELTLSPDSLTLVVVSPDYFHTGSQWRWRRIVGGDDVDVERTYYAIPHADDHGGFGTLVVPTSDPRHEGMRRPDTVERERLTALGLTPDDHWVWTLERRFLAAVDSDLDRRPASADLSENERRGLPIEEAYPVGSVWKHISYDEPVTIESHRGTTVVVLSPPIPEGTVSREWPRGALDAYGTFVGWSAPESDSEAPQSDDGPGLEPEVQRLIDEAVAEAVAAERLSGNERLEEWKREANRIAVEYAESNDLCGNFEAAMSDIGLLGREEWHDQNDPEFRVTFTVTVRAGDEYDAKDKASEYVYAMGHGSLYDAITEVEGA